MATTPDLDKLRTSLTDGTAVYAVVGATDLAAELVRDARQRATPARLQHDVLELPVKAAVSVSSLAERVQGVPAMALDGTRALGGRAQESYEQLADRGQRLVSRVREQRATQDLLSQAESTVTRGRAVVTSARRAAVDTRRSAKGTLTTARHSSAAVADDLADEVTTTRRRVRKTTSPTKTAAKRTATTARKRATTTKRATKATGTSARKTAATARAAAKDATAKVGD